MSTEAYVAALDDALVGPARVRRGLVQEARDHLEDAVDAYRRGGLDRSDAERLAVDDFGTLDEIVPAFQATLAVASSRRTAWLLFAALAIQPFIWDGPIGPTDPDGHAYALLNALVEVGGGLMLATSLVLLVATGIGNRWFAAGRGIARLTSFATLGATVSLKLSGIAMVLFGGGASEPVLWLLLVAFIVVPMSLAGASARRTLATC